MIIDLDGKWGPDDTLPSRSMIMSAVEYREFSVARN